MRSSLFSGFVISVLACHTFFGSAKENRVIGNIDVSGRSGEVIRAPSTVPIDEPFDVIVTTRGSSCIRADGADVEVKGLIALITPLDILNYAHGCLEYDAPYPRSVKLRFNAVGAGVIRVRGRNYNDEAVMIERAIAVTPVRVQR